MYQVIVTYSENEPWWFFDEWQEDIKEKFEYDCFCQAKKRYDTLANKFEKEFEENRVKPPLLAAFWNDEELIYCEDCDEELQAYKGLMLVKDYQKLDDGDLEKNEAINNSGKAKCCPRYR
ncbi:DUF1033 family protein [Vagococcus hydrophili]|uniref:DUF1033 family protein n=1 Tax=Vagococcus hydrophili TaxID=2714947 RepID=A0A6G8AX76_9ENTE|nr:DUF1033 family protein [Vagococcus hydrophili]QIL49580.1 DUF1033 family protein [Vagococcus hydrophili]